MSASNRAQKGGLALHIDAGQITHDLTSHLQGLDLPIEKAINRAMNKVARWLRTHSVREIGKELKIKQSIIRNRYRFSKSGKGGSQQINIWVGLLAVAAHQAGPAAQNSAGTKVKGRQFDSAFKAKIYNSDERVFIRSAANMRQGHVTLGDPTQKQKRQQRNAGHKRKGLSRDLPAKLRGRFPVEVVGIDIEDIGQDILERYEGRINRQYGKILEQELNFALNVEQ
jgi:hypothetical protein